MIATAPPGSGQLKIGLPINLCIASQLSHYVNAVKGLAHLIHKLTKPQQASEINSLLYSSSHWSSAINALISMNPQL